MDPFLGQIRLFGFGYAPVGWAFCRGQALNIRDFPALFSLLGTSYGGDGVRTFGLPNLQAYVLYGANPDPVGTTRGAATVSLDQSTMAGHVHNLIATTQPGTSATAANDVFAAAVVGGKGSQVPAVLRYSTASVTTRLAQGSIGPAGQGQAHNNLQPYLVLNYCIALQGIFPPRPPTAAGSDAHGQRLPR